ncbi:hypothetical protein JB92DRAFT_2825459 [Gautieria morchelliformis]|nr:hypothetical protein JB92DRAFT_2825459 [Gautieria morchelliformis]
MAHENSLMDAELGSGLANGWSLISYIPPGLGSSLAAFLTDSTIFNSEDVTDICIGEQGITCAASISPGEFVTQGSSQHPDASLAITPGEYKYSTYPQHTFMQIADKKVASIVGGKLSLISGAST